MKKNLFVIVLCFLTINLFGQRNETLFGKARVIGAFGGPIIEFGDFNKDMTTSVGGGGGLIIDNFFIGGYGMGTTDLTGLDINGESFQLDMGHGGFWLGFTFRQYKLLHVFASAKIGWGGIDVNFAGGQFDAHDNIIVSTPELGLELNIFRWFKIAGTIGYRNVVGVTKVMGQTNDSMSGMIGGLTFRFGGFGHWRDRDDW